MAKKDINEQTGTKLSAQDIISRLNNVGYHMMYTSHGRVMCWHENRKDDSFLKRSLANAYLEALRRTKALKVS